MLDCGRHYRECQAPQYTNTNVTKTQWGWLLEIWNFQATFPSLDLHHSENQTKKMSYYNRSHPNIDVQHKQEALGRKECPHMVPGQWNQRPQLMI